MLEYVTFETGCSTSHLAIRTSHLTPAFFTTKPTGQGTGLGQSLSYDIVKAHGGEMKVETLPAEAAAQAGKEGEGSAFIIQIPIV